MVSSYQAAKCRVTGQCLDDVGCVPAARTPLSTISAACVPVARTLHTKQAGGLRGSIGYLKNENTGFQVAFAGYAGFVRYARFGIANNIMCSVHALHLQRERLPENMVSTKPKLFR